MNDQSTPPEHNAPHIENVRVQDISPLIPPSELKSALPITPKISRQIADGRAAVDRILAGENPRLLTVVGPCSIHDPKAAIEYAQRLKELSDKVADRYYIVMRVYFEKPRTTIGWKGLINDPHLDDSCDLIEGLRIARKLLLDVAEIGLPAATEFLDPIVPQFIGDLITWAAIGARTTESQTHREMASGLSMPVGFKNGTDGSVQTAIDAMKSARAGHSFLGIDQTGRTSVVKTAGNPATHLVLRGGRQGPNFERKFTAEAAAVMSKAGLNPALMVDCSHSNSGKDPARQPIVWADLLKQRADKAAPVTGAMLESFLHEGTQPLQS